MADVAPLSSDARAVREPVARSTTNPLIGPSFPDETMHACRDMLAVLACLGEFEDIALFGTQHGIWGIAELINGALAYKLAAQRQWAAGDKEVRS